MRKIYAIGGGEISKLETLEIDREIVKATGKEKPAALFIPTASGDAQGYIASFHRVYGEILGCKTDMLLLVNHETAYAEAKEKILGSDIVYVGGGNTRKMMKIWTECQVDKLLMEAYEKGIILSGLSAGSICWFQYGHSDSESFETEGVWKYIRVDGLNLINAIHCPHYNEDNRAPDFEGMVLKTDIVGIALENNSAIEMNDDTYKIHKSCKDAKAYKIFHTNGILYKEELENVFGYKLLSELLQMERRASQ